MYAHLLSLPTVSLEEDSLFKCSFLIHVASHPLPPGPHPSCHLFPSASKHSPALPIPLGPVFSPAIALALLFPHSQVSWSPPPQLQLPLASQLLSSGSSPNCTERALAKSPLLGKCKEEFVVFILIDLPMILNIITSTVFLQLPLSGFLVPFF